MGCIVLREEGEVGFDANLRRIVTGRGKSFSFFIVARSFEVYSNYSKAKADFKHRVSWRARPPSKYNINTEKGVES